MYHNSRHNQIGGNKENRLTGESEADGTRHLNTLEDLDDNVVWHGNQRLAVLCLLFVCIGQKLLESEANRLKYRF
jgi:hypothetical protein